MTPVREPTIVVGADGSERSVEALRWAADYARATSGRIKIITGYTVPFTILVVPTYTQADYRRDAEEVLQRTIETAGDVLEGIEVNAHVVEVRPALALINAAQDADLVVIGSHGFGGFPGMHLGSTASYLVHHSPCPVVVCRGSD